MACLPLDDAVPTLRWPMELPGDLLHIMYTIAIITLRMMAAQREWFSELKKDSPAADALCNRRS